MFLYSCILNLNISSPLNKIKGVSILCQDSDYIITTFLAYISFNEIFIYYIYVLLKFKISTNLKAIISILSVEWCSPYQVVFFEKSANYEAIMKTDVEELGQHFCSYSFSYQKGLAWPSAMSKLCRYLTLEAR